MSIRHLLSAADLTRGEAGTRGDAALLLGISLFAAVFVFVGNTLADVFARLVDPRMDRLEMHHHGH